MPRGRRAWKKVRRLARRLWHRARNERATPREVGEAVFLGVFSGCTPAVGFHGWVAVFAATLFRRNRLYAWLGSRVSNFVFMPFIVLAEIQCSRLLRTGKLAPITREHVLEQAPELLLDWGLGSVVVGIALGALFGALAWRWAHRRDRREERARAAASAPAPSSSSRWTPD
ncbi:MAG: DUF2062 domain-containing protein [Myxococcales bacterium]|nr:DUF2062 domain-containing protein [Myxococcales bacterium]HQY64896.1 DUF2062 domain-containing protein [Polyangiaceae bacterium]